MITLLYISILLYLSTFYLYLSKLPNQRISDNYCTLSKKLNSSWILQLSFIFYGVYLIFFGFFSYFIFYVGISYILCGILFTSVGLTIKYNGQKIHTYISNFAVIFYIFLYVLTTIMYFKNLILLLFGVALILYSFLFVYLKNKNYSEFKLQTVLFALLLLSSILLQFVYL